MRKPKTHKKGYLFWRNFYILVGLCALGVVLVVPSELFTTNIPLGFAQMMPTPTITPAVEEEDNYLDVWVDTGASMKGFLYEIKKNDNRIPSSYRAVLEGIPKLTAIIGQTAKTAYYHFDSNFNNLDKTETNDQRQTERNRQVFDEERTGYDNAILYANTVDKGNNSVSLPSVLNVLNLDRPSVILTDFEADGLALPSSEYKLPLERIYSAGLCVSVVAMKSAYSGVLYNYLNDGTDYSFAEVPTKHEPIKIRNGHLYSYPPRPFYAIIVASSDQCANFEKTLKSLYSDFCEEKITRQAKVLKKIDGYSYTEYIELQQADYCLSGAYAVLKAVDGNNVSITPGKGFQLVKSDLTKQGIPEYTCVKADDLKTATLDFTVHPASSIYSATYSTDLYTIPELKIQRIEQTKKFADELMPEDTYLPARGPRRIVPELEDFKDSGHWFTCTEVKGEEDGVHFTLSLNAAACKAGMYILTIPVECAHSKNALEASDTGWIANWSITADQMNKRFSDVDIAGIHTVDLAKQLKQFHDADINQNHKDKDSVAELTVDVNVQ